MGPGGRASQGPKQAAAIKKKIVKRDVRRNLKRGALGAAALITADKLIGDKLKSPPMAGTDTSSSGGSRTVKSGQTLSQIAKDNGTTLKALLAANPSIKNANKIKVGQKIKLSKPVKKRKSVYQGISKAGMKKMAMPKKKKMGGGKVYKRGGGKALRGFGNATYSNKMI
jgi:LysM repeat protein